MMRYRFQFRLRTLLAIVAVLSVSFSYLGHQLKVIDDRNAVLARIAGEGGGYEVSNCDGPTALSNGDVFDSSIIEFGRVPNTIRGCTVSWYDDLTGNNPSQIRRLLGDKDVIVIFLAASVPESERAEIAIRFPEAVVIP